MIKVYGFPRSGNNLLAKYIADTFYPDQDTALHNLKWGHWSKRMHKGTNPYGKCLGSHVEFPKGAVFIIRDTVDVAYSIWRSEGFTHVNDDSTFSEFIRKPLDWRFTPPMRYHGDKTVIEHHIDHLYQSRYGLWVDYTLLTLNPEGIMKMISERYGLEIKQFNRIDKPIGYSPNWGSGSKRPDAEDRKYIDNRVEEYLANEYPNFLGKHNPKS